MIGMGPRFRWFRSFYDMILGTGKMKRAFTIMVTIDLFNIGQDFAAFICVLGNITCCYKQFEFQTGLARNRKGFVKK